jgi:hypothetical protein
MSAIEREKYLKEMEALLGKQVPKETDQGSIQSNLLKEETSICMAIHLEEPKVCRKTI